MCEMQAEMQAATKSSVCEGTGRFTAPVIVERVEDRMHRIRVVWCASLCTRARAEHEGQREAELAA